MCFFPSEALTCGSNVKNVEGLFLCEVWSNTAVRQTHKLSNAAEVELGQRNEGSSSKVNATGTIPPK